VFYTKLKKAKMKQSMSRVAKCINNGPMEGFWGILKRERYYDGEVYKLSLGGIKRLPATHNRVTGSKKIFILFHCPLDGEQFTSAVESFIYAIHRICFSISTHFSMSSTGTNSKRP